MPDALSVEIADERRGSRAALLLATDTYTDPGWKPLEYTVSDARALADVLGDPRIGDFDVEVMENRSAQEQRLALAVFFANRGPHDVLVVHLGCHAEKDARGRLHFAAADTARDHVLPTGIEAELLRTLMTGCRSRSIILLLDCCFAAAFTADASRSGSKLDLQDTFKGQGHAVLSATSATELAWEDAPRARSVFTGALVEGLQSGTADLDRDGWVSLIDLHDYLRAELERDGRQKPSLSIERLEGKLVIAAAQPNDAGPLPTTVALAAASPLMEARREAVIALAGLLDGDDVDTARAARIVLHRLARDDSKTVSAAAAEAIGTPDRTTAFPPRSRSSRYAVEHELEGLHRERVSPESSLAEVSLGALVEAIDGCQRVVSRDETRPGLTGLIVEFETNLLVMSGTDSYRLGRYELEAVETKARDSLTFPLRAMKELRDELVDRQDTTVVFGLVGKKCTIHAGDYASWCYVRDSSVPNLRRLLSSDATSLITIERRSLLDAAERVLKASSKYAPARIVITPPTVHLRSDKHRKGIRLESQAPVAMPAMQIGINPEFLHDAVESLHGDWLNVAITSPLRPLELRSPSGRALHMVMPIRLLDDSDN